MASTNDRKEKSYWLRGGLIGVFFAVFLVVLASVISNAFPYAPYDIAYKISSFSQYLAFPVIFPMELILNNTITLNNTNEEKLMGIAGMAILASTIICYFIYGAIVGSFIRKNKPM